MLESSSSIQHFYSYVFKDSKNKSHKIQECALRGREILDSAADRYVRFVTEITSTIKNNNLKYQTISDRHELILSLIDGWIRRFETQGARIEELEETLADEVYIYFSHILHRALLYLKQNNQNIDQNDYEDSQICLHLSLDSKFNFITDDKNLFKSVNQTLDLLHELKIDSFLPLIRVNESNYLNGL